MVASSSIALLKTFLQVARRYSCKTALIEDFNSVLRPLHHGASGVHRKAVCCHEMLAVQTGSKLPYWHLLDWDQHAIAMLSL